MGKGKRNKENIRERGSREEKKDVNKHRRIQERNEDVERIYIYIYKEIV